MKLYNRLQQTWRQQPLVYYTTTIFAALQLVMLRFHEMWRDEIQAWSIARSAHSPLDLYHNLHFEGHPALWHFLLFAASRITGNPIAMQFMHIGIATAIVFLIMKYAPFSRLQRVLLSFGYFSFYEYGVIARNYNLGFLIIILLCIALTRARKNYIKIGILLFLLAQANPMAALLVPALTLYVVLDATTSIHNVRENFRSLLAMCGIAALGLVVFYLQVKQPPGSGIGTAIGPDIRNALSTIWQSYMPIPGRIVRFWNTNILTSFEQVVMLSIGLLMLMVYYFSRNTKLLAAYLAGTITLLLFFDMKNLGSLRHQGALYLLLIFCVWLLFGQKKHRKDIAFMMFQKTVFSIILFVQVLGTLAAVIKDIRLPFSHAKATAMYIQKNNLQDKPIVGLTDYTTTPVVGYLDRQAYYPDSNTKGSFIPWIQHPIYSLDEKMRRAAEFTKINGNESLVLSNAPLPESAYSGLKLITSINSPVVVADEVYYLYSYRP